MLQLEGATFVLKSTLTFVYQPKFMFVTAKWKVIKFLCLMDLNLPYCSFIFGKKEKQNQQKDKT